MNVEQAAARDKKLLELQEKLGYTFRDRGLLELALCHSSYSNENGGESNERLEFLGDAVLELTVSHILFDLYSSSDEGHLTRERSKLVCKSSLVVFAAALELRKLILCGKSMQQTKISDSTCADAFEAILGALYLDGGYDEAFKVVVKQLSIFDESKKPKKTQNTDPKSRLQALTQERKEKMPHYETISVEGPDHAPLFKVKVSARGGEWFGEGRSKKLAESRAAQRALADLPADEPTEPTEPPKQEKGTEKSLISRLFGFLKTDIKK